MTSSSDTSLVFNVVKASACSAKKIETEIQNVDIEEAAKAPEIPMSVHDEYNDLRKEIIAPVEHLRFENKEDFDAAMSTANDKIDQERVKFESDKNKYEARIKLYENNLEKIRTEIKGYTDKSESECASSMSDGLAKLRTEWGKFNDEELKVRIADAKLRQLDMIKSDLEKVQHIGPEKKLN